MRLRGCGVDANPRSGSRIATATLTEGMSGYDALWIQDRRGYAASTPMGVMTAMNSVTIFWMQLITSVFVFSLVAVWYVWPYLTKLSRNSALIALLFVHTFRM